MPQRKYSVDDIDRMRKALEHQWLFGRKLSDHDPVVCDVTVYEDDTITIHFNAATTTFSRSYTEEEKTRCVEEHLRTCMAAGIDPSELE